MDFLFKIFFFIFILIDFAYSQSPFIDPLITNTLQSSPTADILCILKTSNNDLKKRTDHFSTKNEKGEYVFNTLRAEAEKTQKEIKKYLSRNGYEYRAFYIVNGIHVAKADRDLVEYLRRRDEVERIEFNSSIF